MSSPPAFAVAHLSTRQAAGDAPVAVVTGAGRNIGRAIAKRLQEDGYRIIGTVFSDDPLEGTGAPARVETAEGQALGEQEGWDIVSCDLSDAGACAGLVDLATARYERLDCVVHNAATWTYGPALEVPDADWTRVFDVSVLALVRVVRAAEAMLKASPHPRVVALSSISADWAGIGVAPYSVAKAGVSALVRALAVELASSGILINAVAPGFIATTSNPQLEVPDDLRRRLSVVPLARAGLPEEVADVVSFLASPRLGFVTGSTVRIDGGQLAGGER